MKKQLSKKVYKIRLKKGDTVVVLPASTKARPVRSWLPTRARTR
jgi:aminoglycoside N3'-acetyltransferase